MLFNIDSVMWLFVILSLWGNIQIIAKKPTGFLIWIITNISWVLYDLYKGIYSQAALFSIYTFFAAWGYIEWKSPSTIESIRNYLKKVFT